MFELLKYISTLSWLERAIAYYFISHHITKTVSWNLYKFGRRSTVCGGRLSKRFCNMFSRSYPCSLGQHGSCSSAPLPVELSEKMLQNLFLNLPHRQHNNLIVGVILGFGGAGRRWTRATLVVAVDILYIFLSLVICQGQIHLRHLFHYCSFISDIFQFFWGKFWELSRNSSIR